MGQVLLLVVVALTVAAVVFGVTVLVTGSDNGLGTAEPDGRAVPLPGTRPLVERDVAAVRFDTTVRGYRMGQVDQALRRAAYDIGYKEELISVLEAEVIALREGREADADVLRRAREAALVPAGGGLPEKPADATIDLDVVPDREQPAAEPAAKPADKSVPVDKDEPAAKSGAEPEPAAKAESTAKAEDAADRDDDTPADESPARP
ncbi:DivIVA domain-containing protein [Actinomycetes bacterium KLBMP 9797]